jgi:FkbM family methyltransferase
MSLKDWARAGVPSGLLELLRRKRGLQALGYQDNAWAAAASPRVREMLRTSRLPFFPAELLRHAKCVVDVGAHVGTWSEAVLELIRPQRLIAVEPTPDSFKALRHRIGSNPAVELVQAAVGASSGEASFRVMSDPLFNSFHPVQDDLASFYPHVEQTQTIQVQLVTLDELLGREEEVTVLKVDVQGGESAVLDGANEVLQRTSAVMLEVNFVSHYKGDTLFVDLHRRMTEEFSFELFRYAEPHYLYGRLMYADAIYLNPRRSRAG